MLQQTGQWQPGDANFTLVMRKIWKTELSKIGEMLFINSIVIFTVYCVYMRNYFTFYSLNIFYDNLTLNILKFFQSWNINKSSIWCSLGRLCIVFSKIISTLKCMLSYQAETEIIWVVCLKELALMLHV